MIFAPRTFHVLAATALVSVLGAAPGSALAALPYAGKTLRVLSFNDTHAAAVAKRLPEFEKLTGAKVVFDAIASNTVAAKTTSDQAAGGSYDLYTVDEPFMPQLAPFFVPLAQWPAPKTVDKSELAPERYLPAALAGGSYKGTNFGLPINGNVYMYVYRKDLFSDAKERDAFKAKYKYELKAPTTTAQMRDVAEFFTRPPSMYGFAPFTKMSEGTTVEAIWVLSTFGVRSVDTPQALSLDAAKATEAFQFYLDMMKFAPPGATAWHHAERMAAYSKGKLAQMMTWPSFVKDLENPQKSLVVGKNDYAPPPAGPAGKPSAVAGTWTLALPKSSKQKELASEFAGWWASASFGKSLVESGMNPARRDLLQDAALVKSNPWFPGILSNFEGAVVRPRSPDYNKLSDVVSRHFTKMIAGQATADATVKAMDAEISRLTSLPKK